MNEILLAWIGKTDLEEMPRMPATGRGGPVVSLLGHRLPVEFSEIHLLSACYPQAEIDKYLAQLRNCCAEHEIRHHRLELDHPMDHGAIYQQVTRLLLQLKKKRPGLRFAFHLSPGTSAMAAVWLLIGRTHTPADFYRTWIAPDGGLEVDRVEIPFKIDLEFIPGLQQKIGQEISESWLESPVFKDFFGNTPIMLELKKKARRAADYDVPVLLLGPSGSGKDLLARAIHQNSARSKQAFEAINCGAIPDNLAEAELFGYKKGAFTGAERDRQGAFSRCSSGTLFLDEVADLPLPVQAKLLRVLQNGSFLPLGAGREENTSARIIAATNRSLREMITAGGFRADLFQRLAVAVLEIPPLTRRREDIPGLSRQLLQEINQEFSRYCLPDREYSAKKLAPEALDWLARQDWPGNVRELQNLLKRCVLWGETETIGIDLLISQRLSEPEIEKKGLILPEAGIDLEKELLRIEREYAGQAITRAGTKTRAASLLGLNAKTFITRCRDRLNL